LPLEPIVTVGSRATGRHSAGGPSVSAARQRHFNAARQALAVAFVVIVYALGTLAWQGISGQPPSWADWFAVHLVLIALAVMYLGQSYRMAIYRRIARRRFVGPDEDAFQRRSQ
jgi:phosphatidylglycerophosphate synthase